MRGRGAHSHADGLNLGLYYRGVDLMVDLGYPPVNYGGWSSAQAEWYRRTASHNTVCVDGLDQATAAGDTLWWLDGEEVRGICVSAPGLVDGGRCERTLVMVDTGEEDVYLVTCTGCGPAATTPASCTPPSGAWPPAGWNCRRPRTTATTP